MANKALINYYARLVKRGTYTMEQVQEDLRADVAEVVETLPEPEFDPVTQTPADDSVTVLTANSENVE